jgi:hypothetical protein
MDREAIYQNVRRAVYQNRKESGLPEWTGKESMHQNVEESSLPEWTGKQSTRMSRKAVY